MQIKPKIIRNFVSLLLVVCFLVSMTKTAYGKGIVLEVDQPEIAQVIDIIDGEAIKVRYYSELTGTPRILKLKLIGVKTSGNDLAFNYMLNQLLGRTVLITYDINELPEYEDYVNAYVYFTTEYSINEDLIKRGYADIDETYYLADQYEEFLSLSGYAKRLELGLWKSSNTEVEGININTASSSVLIDFLDMTSDQAYSIITYRKENIINSVTELGFVNDLFTRDYLIENQSKIHVLTNITSASLTELSSLLQTSNSNIYAQQFIDYRTFNPIESKEDIQVINKYYRNYSDYSDFITVDFSVNELDNVTFESVNLNTASMDSMMSLTDLGDTAYEQFISYGNKGYIFRSIEELTKAGYPLTSDEVNANYDELHIITAINSCTEREIESLFDRSNFSDAQIENYIETIIHNRPYSSFDDLRTTIDVQAFDYIEPYISIKNLTSENYVPININTADIDTIVNYLDLSYSDRKKLEESQGLYVNCNSINFALDKRNMMTCYTNINSASIQELMIMDDSIDLELASAIVEYRSLYPFYTLSDLRQCLVANSAYGVYTTIKDFVTFR